MIQSNNYSLLSNKSNRLSTGVNPLSKSLTPVLVRPKKSLGALYPDVVIEESHSDDLEITEHPVEQGAVIHDHAYKKPVTVTIHAGVSDSRMGSNGMAVALNSTEKNSERASQDFYAKLLELQASREPFDIITGKRKYENMLIKSLTAITNQDTENCLMFTVECQEVIIVKTQVVSVPPRENHKNPARTGATIDKGQKQAEQKDSSIAGATGVGKTRAEWEAS